MPQSIEQKCMDNYSPTKEIEILQTTLVSIKKECKLNFRQ